MTSQHDIRRRTIHGLFWQFLGQGGQRVIALAGPMVLARTLPEHDIGLFVVVLSGIGAIEALTLFMGEQTTIWSSRGGERSYLDTVFTVRILRSLVISALLCALAPALAWFFRDPAVEERYWLTGLFLAFAGNGLIDALQSPARAVRIKDLDFRRIALGDFLGAALGTGLTVVLALLWRDVWAMLIGHMGGTALRVAASYAIAPHRPRLRLEREAVRELLGYGKGAAGTPFLLLMIFQAPAFVLGKIAGTGAVAVFDYAGRLARLPEDVFLRVLGPVAVPAYAQIQHDVPKLGRAWLAALRTFTLVGMPLTVAMAWCGDALPRLVFGEKYGAVPGLFGLLALHGGLAGVTAVIGPMFWAIGKPHLDRRAQFARCAVLYGLGVPAALWGGMQGFALAACAGIGTALALSLVAALALLRLPASALGIAARDGTAISLVLGALLVGVDAACAPDGIVRILVAGCASGPLLAWLGLRILRQKRVEPPPAAAVHALGGAQTPDAPGAGPV